MIKRNVNHIQNVVSEERKKRYDKFTNGAYTYQSKKDILRMALCLYMLQNEKLYIDGGYTSIYELATDLYKLSKGTISGYINIAKKFLNAETGRTIFATDKGDFGYLQLLELKKLKVDEAKELVESGLINYHSTANEIKTAIVTYQTLKKSEIEKEKEDSIRPIKEAYEKFHEAYNKLDELVGEEMEKKELLQSIMDSVVILYNENDRLWS